MPLDDLARESAGLPQSSSARAPIIMISRALMGRFPEVRVSDTAYELIDQVPQRHVYYRANFFIVRHFAAAER